MLALTFLLRPDSKGEEEESITFAHHINFRSSIHMVLIDEVLHLAPDHENMHAVYETLLLHSFFSSIFRAV